MSRLVGETFLVNLLLKMIQKHMEIFETLLLFKKMIIPLVAYWIILISEKNKF